MDVVQFLELPIDIRKQVYYHLNGNFSSITPPPLEQLYATRTINLALQTEELSLRQKSLKKKFYDLFAPYLNIFDYSPSLVGKWLEYSLWLRYDSIVLDCMRLNHAYGGSLVGQVDWIYLGGRLRLSYFKNCMLLVWYTLQEYARWIIGEEYEDGELDGVNFFRVNLEWSNLESLRKIFRSMNNNDLFLLVSEVFMDQDDEMSEKSSVDDSEDEATYPIEDLKVIELISNIEAMKNLTSVSVRGDHLFEALINFHGTRDNPGKTLSYVVRKRVMRLELLQLGEPTRNGLADFTRWENLRELRFVNLNSIDLSKLVLPPRCKILILTRVSTIKWWDLENRISSVAQERTITKVLNDRTRLKILDRKSVNPEDLGRCQSIVWQAFKHLNYLKLQNVEEIQGGKIVIPYALYNNKRVLIFPTTSKVQEILIV